MNGISTIRGICSNVNKIKLLTLKLNTAGKPLNGISGAGLQGFIRDRYLLRVYNRWGILSLFFLQGDFSVGSVAEVNYVHRFNTDIIFNILAGQKSVRAVRDEKGYYSFSVINYKEETGEKGIPKVQSNFVIPAVTREKPVPAAIGRIFPAQAYKASSTSGSGIRYKSSGNILPAAVECNILPCLKDEGTYAAGRKESEYETIEGRAAGSSAANSIANFKSGYDIKGSIKQRSKILPTDFMAFSLFRSGYVKVPGSYTYGGKIFNTLGRKVIEKLTIYFKKGLITGLTLGGKRQEKEHFSTRDGEIVYRDSREPFTGSMVQESVEWERWEPPQRKENSPQNSSTVFNSLVRTAIEKINYRSQDSILTGGLPWENLMEGAFLSIKGGVISGRRKAVSEGAEQGTWLYLQENEEVFINKNVLTGNAFSTKNEKMPFPKKGRVITNTRENMTFGSLGGFTIEKIKRGLVKNTLTRTVNADKNTYFKVVEGNETFFENKKSYYGYNSTVFNNYSDLTLREKLPEEEHSGPGDWKAFYRDNRETAPGNMKKERGAYQGRNGEMPANKGGMSPNNNIVEVKVNKTKNEEMFLRKEESSYAYDNTIFNNLGKAVVEKINGYLKNDIITELALGEKRSEKEHFSIRDGEIVYGDSREPFAESMGQESGAWERWRPPPGKENNAHNSSSEVFNNLGKAVVEKINGYLKNDIITELALEEKSSGKEHFSIRDGEIVYRDSREPFAGSMGQERVAWERWGPPPGKENNAHNSSSEVFNNLGNAVTEKINSYVKNDRIRDLTLRKKRLEKEYFTIREGEIVYRDGQKSSQESMGQESRGRKRGKMLPGKDNNTRRNSGSTIFNNLGRTVIEKINCHLQDSILTGGLPWENSIEGTFLVIKDGVANSSSGRKSVSEGIEQGNMLYLAESEEVYPNKNTLVLRDKSEETLHPGRKGMSFLSVGISKKVGPTGGKYAAGLKIPVIGTASGGETVYYETVHASKLNGSELSNNYEPVPNKRSRASIPDGKKLCPGGMQETGKELVEKVVRNVLRILKENRLERYLTLKERFEKSIEKNPYFNRADSNDSSLIQSYSSFKEELDGMKSIFLLEAPNFTESAAHEKGNGVGEKRFIHLKETLDGPNILGMAREVLSHFLIEKQAVEIYGKKQPGLLKDEKKMEHHKVRMPAIDKINNHEAVIRRKEINRPGLRLLQNNNPAILSGKVSYKDRGSGTPEMIILALPAVSQDYTSGYSKSLPPITLKSEEQSIQKSLPQEPVVKSLNTPVEMPKKTVTQAVNDVDMMNPAELKKLVDKVYSQLERKLANERRRFGY